MSSLINTVKQPVENVETSANQLYNPLYEACNILRGLIHQDSSIPQIISGRIDQTRPVLFLIGLRGLAFPPVEPILGFGMFRPCLFMPFMVKAIRIVTTLGPSGSGAPLLWPQLTPGHSLFSHSAFLPRRLGLTG